MAKVLLVSTARTKKDFLDDDYERVKRSAARDSFKVHSITEDPDAADLIIFFEPDDHWLARDVRTHPFVRRYSEKVFLVDGSDRVVPFLPGVYASIERSRYDRSRVRSGFFPFVYDYDWITYQPDGPVPTLLFSFVGSKQELRVRAETQRPHLAERHAARGRAPRQVPGRAVDQRHLAARG